MQPSPFLFRARSGRIIPTGVLLFLLISPVLSGPMRVEYGNGLNYVSGDLADYFQDGVTSALTLGKSSCPGLDAGLGFNYTRYDHQSSLGPRSDGNRTLTESMGFHVSAEYGYRYKRVAATVSGRSGLSFIRSPEITIPHPGTDLTVRRLNAYKGAALDAGIGAGITVYLCRGLELFAQYERASLLNSAFTVEERDISGAVDAIGLIDPDLAEAVPFNASNPSLVSNNVRFGISVALGGSGTRAKDYNSSRSNTSSVMPLDDLGGDGGSGTGQGNTRARDYNSSRSNISTAAGPKEDVDKGGGPRGTQAQDYNSSRSNNINAANPSGSGSGNGGTKAQDYNSSRSNTTTAVGPKEDVDKGDGAGSDTEDGTRAQDYNSIRSRNEASPQPRTTE